MKKILMIVVLFNIMLFARTDALVVGVGTYKNLKHPLQGIPLDIKNIKTILDALSVPRRNIEVLQDEEATLYSVREAFKRYIHSKKNRVGNIFIFYFSGHGIQVEDISGDEKDNKDEASVLYDFMADKTGEVSKGILIDDELYTLLTKIKSKKILIFDKCHSGSSYRGFSVGFEKIIKGDFFLSKGFAKRIKALPQAGDPLLTNVVLSATKAKETAEDSLMGGLFTRSLLEGIVYNKAKNDNGVITLESLEKFCNLNVFRLAVYIKEHNKGYEELKGAFHPLFRASNEKDYHVNIANVFHTQIKQSKPTLVASKVKLKQKKYLLEDTLDGMVSNNVITATLTVPQNKFTLDEPVSFILKSKKSGYINVLIAYKDRYKLFMKNRKIKADRKGKMFPDNFLFVGDKIQRLVTKKPYGLTKVYVILSKKPWDIESNIRNLGQDKTDDLALSHALTKELIPSIEYDINQKKKKLKEKKVVQVKPNILGITKVEFNVTR